VKYYVVLLVGLLLLPAPSVLAEDALSPMELSKRMDLLYRAKTSKGRMVMKVVTPNYSRTLKMSVTSRGQKDTLIRIKSPRKERGISTLKKGNEMWNYLPKIRKTIRIPPSMMMGSWMGSDFTNDDLVKQSSWENDYTVSWAKDVKRDGETCVRSVPKPGAVVNWSQVVSCFDSARTLPTVMTFYDEKKRKVRSITYSDIKVLGGRTVPTKMTLKPLLKEGHQTVIIYEDMAFDIELPETTFTLTNLRRGR
jgi:outer membrane lipoprotein-sorting protein